MKPITRLLCIIYDQKYQRKQKRSVCRLCRYFANIIRFLSIQNYKYIFNLVHYRVCVMFCTSPRFSFSSIISSSFYISINSCLSILAKKIMKLRDY
ncbi:hypothetical protein MXB_3181 [Myxobolus squamalis]|nr:hypothetical protein MXB_3181 [Myxobolus squamalis]